MNDWLAIGLGGATFVVPVVVLAHLASWAALRLRPPDDWGELPSPLRPPDVVLLSGLPVYASLFAGALGAGAIVTALGAEASYGEALATWAKALTPLAVVFLADAVRDALTVDGHGIAARARGELYEPPPTRSSSRRAQGVVIFVACAAGMLWAIGLPEPQEPIFYPPGVTPPPP
ncbi:MAG TPA: hypothetical protein VG318_03560 [Actinomycetota bacterium]|nr:hypothetical protein [Actinomycetota bacterium]